MTTYETRACTACGKGWPAVASANCPFCNPAKQTAPREAAMCEKAHNQGSRGEKWDDISEGHRREWLGIADAALDVLMEPTKGMAKAALSIDRSELRHGNAAELLGRCMARMMFAAKDGK